MCARNTIFILLMGMVLGCGDSPTASDAGATLGEVSSPADAPRQPSAATGEQIITDSIGARYQLVRAGAYWMGSPEDEPGREDDEGPVREVQIDRDFYLGVTEVTQAQWEAVMGTKPWQDATLVRAGANYPAVYVSWKDAVAFCERLSAKEGVEYRLPTEAEWEYACRAGTRTAYSFGDDASELGSYAWYADNTDAQSAQDPQTWARSDGKPRDLGEAYAHEVAQKRPNPWGFFDMHGNVLEWCADFYAKSAPVVSDAELEAYLDENLPIPKMVEMERALGQFPELSKRLAQINQRREQPLALDPSPGSSTIEPRRVVRGGSWVNISQHCRAANRGAFPQSGDGLYFIGFRVVRSAAKLAAKP